MRGCIQAMLASTPSTMELCAAAPKACVSHRRTCKHLHERQSLDVPPRCTAKSSEVRTLVNKQIQDPNARSSRVVNFAFRPAPPRTSLCAFDVVRPRKERRNIAKLAVAFIATHIVHSIRLIVDLPSCLQNEPFCKRGRRLERCQREKSLVN